jgi:hypothetical protein
MLDESSWPSMAFTSNRAVNIIASAPEPGEASDTFLHA